MRHFKYSSIEATPVTSFDSKGTTIRIFIPKEEAPHYIMRRFDIQAGGSIGVHSHPEEHEIYVLDGELQLIDGDGKKERAVADEFIFVPSEEPHGYVNEVRSLRPSYVSYQNWKKPHKPGAENERNNSQDHHRWPQV